MSGPRGQAFTETWWGSRWIQALRRLGRGWSRSLAAAPGTTDAVRDFKIGPGRIQAVVPGEDDEVYELKIRLRTLSAVVWERVLRRLTRKALYAAKLLSGEMPRDVERVFAQCRASLFPKRRHEVEVECTCDEPDFPCSHVAAAQFVLAEALDRDPFLLFELRGRSKEELLAELREIRSARASTDRAGADALAEEDEEEFIEAPQPDEYDVAGDLASLGFHIAAPDVAVGAIRAVGPPRSWPEPLEVLTAFAPLYRAASAVALDIAWSGEEEVPASAVLPEPETEEQLVALAETMAKPSLPSADEQSAPSRRKRGGRKRRGRRGGAGRRAPNRPSAEQVGKKKRRRRGGRRRGGRGRRGRGGNGEG